MLRRPALSLAAALLASLSLTPANPAAAAGTSRFCAAVAAFDAARPSTTAELTAQLRRLAAAAPKDARTALGAITQALTAEDAGTVLAQAAAAPSPAASDITRAGSVATGAATRACGRGVDFLAARPTGLSTRAVTLAAWVRALCTNLTSFGQGIDQLGSSVGASASGLTTLPLVRGALSQFAGTAALQTEALRAQLDGAGTPKDPQGKPLALAVHDGLLAAEQGFLAAQLHADQLPDTPAAFQTAAQTLVQSLDTTGRQVAGLVGAATAQVRARSITRAVHAEPACASLA